MFERKKPGWKSTPLEGNGKTFYKTSPSLILYPVKKDLARQNGLPLNNVSSEAVGDLGRWMGEGKQGGPKL